MEWGIYLLLLAAIGVTLGRMARASAAALALGWGYVFLSDAANYLNHKYLFCVLAGVLAILPAGDHFRVGRRPPLIGSVPRWTVTILRAQIAIVYTYAGIAKLNADWLAGRPLSTWLSDEGDFPLLGPFFVDGSAPIALARAGALIDLTLVPLILWGRTRWFGLAIAVSFHLMNSALFDIGTFPVMAIACTLMLLPPEWPRSIFRLPARQTFCSRPGRIVTAVAACVLVVQLVLPTRHFFIPGDVHWTEEGHRFAWHMMLRNKRCAMTVRMIDGDDTTEIEVRDYLTRRQARVTMGNPDMVRQFALELANREADGGVLPQVYADVECSLNGGPRGPLVDPEVDLVTARPGAPASWIQQRP
jgi:hypothetical protein